MGGTVTPAPGVAAVPLANPYTPYIWAADPRMFWLQNSRLYGARPWSADDVANWTAVLIGANVPNFQGTGITSFLQGADSFSASAAGGPHL
jgi:hypothetical protein